MSGRRTRVLHVVQNLNYGGMERVLSDLVMRSDRDRFENHVLCLQYLGRFAEGLEDVATLHVAERMPSHSMLFPTALTAQMRAIDPDVVHTHSGVWFKASLAARRAGVPWLVHTEHGREKPDPLRNRIIDGLAARRTDRVVAVSELLAAELPSALWMPARKVVHISNGVDTDVYRPRADTGKIRQELGIAPDVPIVGSIGRLNPIKGYDVMVEAFAMLRGMPGFANAVLVVGGQGASRAALDELVAARGLTGSAHLLGWRDDVHDLQSCFTIFTMSSRSEGTSISLLEAMSAGLAPVVTDVGGNAAVLGEGLRASLVPTERPDLLAARWAALLGDAAERQRVSAQARTRVVEAFGLDAMVRAYETVYAAGSGASASVAGRPALEVAAAPGGSR